MTEDSQNWQAPPPPEAPVNAKEAPQMSLLQTFTDIFFSPGEVFEDLRRKPFPRLIFPLLLCSILISGFSFALNQKLGAVRIIQEQLKSPWMERVPEENKKQMLEAAQNQTTTRTLLNSSIGGIVLFVFFFVSGLLYWGGGLGFGGSGNYWHGLSVVAYASFPPLLISMVASLIILYFKSVDDISLSDAQGGLLKLNPGLFIEGSGIVKALFSRIDLLAIWGVILGKIGMEKVFRISSGSAWLFSIIIWLIGTAFALLFGMLSS